MSLINDVLKDLENKPKQAEQEALALMSGASSVKKTRHSKRLLVYLGMALLLTLFVAAYFGYQYFFGAQAKLKQLSLNVPVAQGSASALPKVSDTRSETASNTQTSQEVAIESDAYVVEDTSNVAGVDSKPSNTIDNNTSGSKTSGMEPSPSKTLEVNALETNIASEISPSKNTSLNKNSKSEIGLNRDRRVSDTPLKVADLSQDSQSQQKQAVQQKQTVQYKHSGQQEKALTADSIASNKKVEIERVQPAQATTNLEREIASSSNHLKEDSSSALVSKNKTLEVSMYENALSAYKAGRFEQSESLADRLLELNQKPDYLALKARLLLKKSPQALVEYLDKNNVDTAGSDNLLALSASAYQRTQDHARAVNAYDLLVQRQPVEGKWWLALAFSLESLGALEKAMKSYSVALQSGTLPANARSYAAKQATQIKVKLEALAKQAEEQE